jgi:hypothetical protein
MKKAIGLVAGIVIAGLMQGCATNLTKPAAAPQPASVRLGTFANVELEPAILAEPFAAAGANQKAAKKINELLNTQMAYVFPGMNSSEKKSGKTLVIKPVIKEIKFIGGAARFWAGAMAGSSAVLMEVTYLEKETGNVLAKVEFYDQASAYAGAWNMGVSDNLMLNHIVTQIVNYSTANR